MNINYVLGTMLIDYWTCSFDPFYVAQLYVII